MDEWGVDVALTGSQKAPSMPTRMGIVCASPKAMEAAKSANSVRVFFDWNDYLKLFKMGTYWPYTPSIQPLHGLRTAPDLLFEEGLDNVTARHSRLGKATRKTNSWGCGRTNMLHWYTIIADNYLLKRWLIICRLAVEAWGLKNRTQEEWWFHLVLTALLWWFHLVLTALIIVKVFRIGHLGNLTDVCLPFFQHGFFSSN